MFFFLFLKLDAETIKIAKQIKALKEGKQQGEIKISLKGEGMVSTVETKLPHARTENPNKKTDNHMKKNSEDHGHAEQDEELVQPEEESKDIPHNGKEIANSSKIQVFNNFDGIRDLKDFLIKYDKNIAYL